MGFKVLKIRNVDYISISICINGAGINGDLLFLMEDLVMVIATSKTNEEENTTEILSFSAFLKHYLSILICQIA